MLEINGYHGTQESSCHSIYKEQRFNHSHGEDEWLGYGIYFFERNEHYAVWWARDYKDYNPFGILKAKISVDEQQILDLSNPENLDELDQYARILTERKTRAKSFADREINDRIVINYIYNHIRRFDMVIGIFDHNIHARQNMTPYYRSRLKAHQIQLCVRTVGCISNIEQVS